MSEKNDLVKGIAILLVIAIISAGGLAALASVTQPIVEERRLEIFRETLEEFFEEEISLGSVGIDDKIFKDKHYLRVVSEDEIIGYVGNLSFRGSGYGSDPIEAIIAFNESLKVKGIKILSNSETPGFGADLLESKEFCNYLLGKRSEELIIDMVKKDIGSVISGATYTAIAVLDALRDACESIKASEEVSRCQSWQISKMR